MNRNKFFLSKDINRIWLNHNTTHENIDKIIYKYTNLNPRASYLLPLLINLDERPSGQKYVESTFVLYIMHDVI